MWQVLTLEFGVPFLLLLSSERSGWREFGVQKLHKKDISFADECLLFLDFVWLFFPGVPT